MMTWLSPGISRFCCLLLVPAMSFFAFGVIWIKINQCHLVRLRGRLDVVINKFVIFIVIDLVLILRYNVHGREDVQGVIYSSLYVLEVNFITKLPIELQNFVGNDSARRHRMLPHAKKDRSAQKYELFIFFCLLAFSGIFPRRPLPQGNTALRVTDLRVKSARIRPVIVRAFWINHFRSGSPRNLKTESKSTRRRPRHRSVAVAQNLCGILIFIECLLLRLGWFLWVWLMAARIRLFAKIIQSLRQRYGIYRIGALPWRSLSKRWKPSWIWSELILFWGRWLIQQRIISHIRVCEYRIN